MSGSKFWRTHPVTFSGPSYIGQILSLDLNDGINTMRLTADGHVDHVASQVMSRTPSISFVTQDLEGVLTLAGYNGADLTTVVAYDGLIIEGGAKSSSGNNKSWTLATAFGYPMSINWSQGNNATIGMMILGTSATGVNPLAIATNASLSTPTIDYDQRWALKDISINGTALTGITDVSINFGINPIPEQFDGNVAALGYTVISRPTVIEFTTADMNDITALAAVSTTTRVRFRKWNNDGTFVADGTSEHIVVTVNGGVVIPAGTSGDPRAMRVRIECNRKSDGTVPLTVTLTTTIT